jgi:hypothetical protein
MQIFFLHVKNPNPIRATVLAACLLVSANNALAALGQPLATVTNNPAAAAATRLSAASSTQSNLYAVRSNTLESGTVVTEYATPAGLVFAVAWKGPVLPPLDAWLGTYFNTFKAQADASRTSRNVGAPLRIDTPELVVRSSGRMRNFSGYGYAPTLVPTGVDIRDVLP